MWCLTQNRSCFKGHVYATHSEICPLHLTHPPLRSREWPPCSAWRPDPGLHHCIWSRTVKETGAPAGNPRVHGENTQTPHREQLGTEPRPLALRGDSANHYASLAADTLQVSAVTAPGNENCTLTDRMSCLTAPIP